MRSPFRSLIACTFALLLFLALAAPAQRTTQLQPGIFEVELETVFVAAEGEALYEGYSSSYGSRFLLMIRKEGKTVVMDQDGRRIEWTATWCPSLDNHRTTLAYVGMKDLEVYAVFDTLVMGPYDYIPSEYPTFSGIKISDDGSHWIFRARQDDDAIVVLDGMEVASGSEFGNFQPVLCPDGKHWAADVRLGDKSAYVVNGVLGRPFKWVTPIGSFSDSCRFAYIGNESDSVHWIISGKDVWGPFAKIPHISFVPHTNDIIYLAKATTSSPAIVYKNDVVLSDLPGIISISIGQSGVLGIIFRNDSGLIQGTFDTEVIPPADSIRGFSIDSSGQHYGYIKYSLRKKNKRPKQYDVQFIFNGFPCGGQYSEIGYVLIPSNGKQVAFTAFDKSHRQFLVVDSATYGPFEEVSSLYYSKDDMQYAAMGSDKDGKHLILNGWQSEGFNEINPFVMFDTLRDVSVYFAQKDRQWLVKGLDSTILTFDRVFGYINAFDSLGVLRGYGCRADTVFRFTLRPPTESNTNDSL